MKNILLGMIVIFSQNILGIFLLSLASSAALKSQLLNSFEDNVIFFFSVFKIFGYEIRLQCMDKKKKNPARSFLGLCFFSFLYYSNWNTHILYVP